MRFLAPRWRKVLRDLWTNKTRTILVLLSISVGVSAIGMVIGSQIIVSQNLPEAYAAVNPSSAIMFSLDTFGDDMVDAIRAMPEIEDAAGLRTVNVRFRTHNDEWRNLQLTAISNFEEMTINKIKPQAGAFPPKEREVLIERASLSPVLGFTDIGIGDTLTVEAPNGKQRQLQISGTVHDMSQLPAFINGAGYGYITYATLEWLGEPRNYNQVVFVVKDNKTDYAHINDVAKKVESRLESAGVDVLFSLVLPPGDHPAQQFLDAFSLILGAIGGLSLVLSGFLIVNTLSAILTQHVRQIGIMKSIGARAGQITGMYYVMVLLFGVLSLFIALPLGALGAVGLANIFAGLLNFDVGGARLEPQVVIIQVFISLLAPVLAATLPIMRGVRISVREAISDQGMGKGQFGKSFIDRMIVFLRYILPIGRPMQISLRNTFRRKSRLTLTLITLSLASTIFIAIFSIRASLQQTLFDAISFFDYDVQIIFDHPYRTERIHDEVANLPGVDAVETWGFTSTRIVRKNETESDNIVVYAPRYDSTMLSPILVEGRWLLPDDGNAIVINSDVVGNEADVADGIGADVSVGSTVTLKINNKDTQWVVVGVIRGVLTGPNIFMNFDALARATNSVGRASISLVRLDDRSAANQLAMGQLLEQRYRDSGFRVQQMSTIDQVRTTISTVFDVIIIFLLFMALLLGVVGGLGLMGTMSINVLERTREIGVMRAVGASNGSILRIILVEGMIIGLLSWTIGGLIALPASRILTDTVGMALLQAVPSYIFSTFGAILWLGIVLVVAFLASFVPARRASQLTVREVLSYE